MNMWRPLPQERSTVMASFHLHYEMLTKFQPSLSYFIILSQILTTYALSALFIYSILLCSLWLLYLTKNKIGNLSCFTWLWACSVYLPFFLTLPKSTYCHSCLEASQIISIPVRYILLFLDSWFLSLIKIFPSLEAALEQPKFTHLSVYAGIFIACL